MSNIQSYSCRVGSALVPPLFGSALMTLQIDNEPRDGMQTIALSAL